MYREARVLAIRERTGIYPASPDISCMAFPVQKWTRVEGIKASSVRMMLKIRRSGAIYRSLKR